MEFALLAVFVLVALGSLALRRHHQVVAWDRELDTAFGAGVRPELSGHRRL